MPPNEPTPQPPRTETACIACTKDEKAAIRAVAHVRGTDTSNLLRTMTLPEILRVADEMRDLFRVDATK